MGSHQLNANSTAVAGVNVTGAAIRLKVPVASRERVPVANQYGAVFAITVRVGFITPALTDCKERHGIAVQGDSL
jgi:hypothetical protein